MQTVMEIQSYCDKEIQYRNTSVMHQIWHDYTISTVTIWSYHYTALQYNQYNLCKENDEGRIRTLHRNLLVPIGYIRDIPTPAPRKMLQKPQVSAKRTIRHKIKELEHPRTDDHTTDISSDDESEHGYCHQSGGTCGQ